MMSELYLTLAVQSTVVLSSAALVNLALRKRSAALRHAVWAASFVVLLLLPVLPQNSWFSVTQTVAAPAALTEPLGRTRIVVNGRSAVNWLAVGMLVHLLVAFLLLLRSVVARMVLEERPVQTPMVVGLWHPRVLWPEGADQWPEERREAALRHEREHIGRLDLWWEMFGLTGTALYWPHPLVWWARKKMTEECEQACDDGVLVGGLAASRYAGHLVEIAREMRGEEKNVSLAGGLAMTRTKNLEQRVRVLLDTERARDGVTRKTVGLVALCAIGLLVPLSGYKLLAQTEGGGLLGTVRDGNGSAVAGAKVTVSMGERKEVTRTNASGEFALPGLPGGIWNLAVKKDGFAEMQLFGFLTKGDESVRVGLVLYRNYTGEVARDGSTAEVPPPPPPPPPPTPTGAIRVGGSVQATKVIHKVAPVYPADCKAAGIEGTVLVRALIAQDGSMKQLNVINKMVDPRLVKASMDVLPQWRYQPTLLNGLPVEVLTEVEINFTLAR